MGWLKLVTFDATGTLLKLRGTVGEQYATACLRHKLKVDHNKLTETFMSNWKKLNKELPCFGTPHVSSREWWERLVRATIADSGVSHKEMGPVFPDIFNMLWNDYSTNKLWEVDPDAKHVLQNLTANGVRVAIVSNFDERLHSVLKSVELQKYFDAPNYPHTPFVTTSREVGYEKPDNVIFNTAIKKAKVIIGKDNLTPERCLHVGDHKKKDVTGALDTGMKAALLLRDSSIALSMPSTLEPYYTINRLGKLLDVVNHVNQTHSQK